MMSISFRHLLAASCLFLLVGCSTPEPILGLAGQGAASVSLADRSLREYVTLTQAQLLARLDLIRVEDEQDARDRAQLQLENALERRAGLPARDQAAELIRDLGNQSRTIRESEAQEFESIAQKTTKDFSTLGQEPREKLSAAKKSFELLSQELSPTEWLALSAAYAREIRAGIKDLKATQAKDQAGKE